MSLAIQVDPLPLETDADGTVRVGGTRVTLDLVIEAFREGLTAEEISQQYSALHLEDVYFAISYYLRHRDAVDAYLQERETLARGLKERLEARPAARAFRERLQARQRPRESSHP